MWFLKHTLTSITHPCSNNLNAGGNRKIKQQLCKACKIQRLIHRECEPFWWRLVNVVTCGLCERGCFPLQRLSLCLSLTGRRCCLRFTHRWLQIQLMTFITFLRHISEAPASSVWRNTNGVMCWGWNKAEYCDAKWMLDGCTTNTGTHTRSSLSVFLTLTHGHSAPGVSLSPPSLWHTAGLRVHSPTKTVHLCACV